MPEKDKPQIPDKSSSSVSASADAAATPAPAPAPAAPAIPPPSGITTPRVLLVDQSLPNRRLITEILTSFHRCEVDASPSAEHAFERIIKYSYDLYIFAFTLPDMSGLVLDRMAAKVHPLIHSGRATAPSVIFLVHSSETNAYKEAQRDARTRGAVPLPLSLDVLMTLAGPLLPSKI